MTQRRRWTRASPKWLGHAGSDKVAGQEPPKASRAIPWRGQNRAEDLPSTNYEYAKRTPDEVRALARRIVGL